MAKNSLAGVPHGSLIPAHVLERDAIAHAAGLAVSHSASDGQLLTDWYGSEAQFRSTGLFSEKFKFPARSKQRNVHHRYARFCCLTVADEQSITFTWPESMPLEIVQHESDSDIQVLQYAEDAGAFCRGKTGYYGEQANLIRAGIIVEGQAPALTRCKNGRVNARSSAYRASGWWLDIYRLPNGKLLVYEERTEDRAKQREEVEPDPMERLPGIIRSLPPFLPGSMSEAEKHHMRVLRGLTEERREIVMEFTERALARSAGDVKPAKPRPGPHLVVDNDATPDGAGAKR